MESLIFDIDGTLWDTRAIVARGYNVELEKMGRPDLFLTAEYLTSLFGKTAQEIADVIFADYPEGERLGLIFNCMETERHVLRADPCQVGYEGVKETLLKLKENHRLFLVSNCECGYPELLVEKLGLQGVFEDHMCHGDTGLPKGDTIRILMERNGITDAVYIGDTQGDCDASRKAGIPFVFCAYGFGSPDRYDAKLEDFRQLPEVLKTI
jgi:phosphoglycolate phosphatase